MTGDTRTVRIVFRKSSWTNKGSDMGNSKSKSKIGSRGKIRGKSGRYDHPGGGKYPGNRNEYEDTELLLLRRAIERDPESFVLNNLMMCVQFFGNYEE